MALPNRIKFVTGNDGKVAELQSMLGPLGVTVEKDPRGYPEEQADTVAEVAKAGAQWLQKEGLEVPFLLEDSGFVIHALKGFPGPYSAYVQQTLGNAGVLQTMESVEQELRTAHFESCLTYVDETSIHQFTGVCKGHVAQQALGTDGFGYDPIFIPLGETRSFAQMTRDEKNQQSHRGKATEAFLAWLANQ